MRRAIYLGGMLAVLVAGAVAAPQARADEWSKTYQINTRADLQVTTDDGDVTITSADQKQIDARVTTIGWKIGPGDVRIEESQNGDHVTVSVKLPHMNWHIFGSNHRSCVWKFGFRASWISMCTPATETSHCSLLRDAFTWIPAMET